ncbi:MAG: CCA tRNA nucleotidyltransferase [Syntrophobacteraceae bacterium]|nr:CCA tRNA nucleotidyltransferase [Syntrophobacteraceae bacterium]
MLITSSQPGLSFVPRDVLKAMERISRAGFEVWLVGGAVRDFLLGIEPRDWDLATSAGSKEIVSLFPAVIPVGIRHGTVQVHTRTRDIEVTSFESPGKSGILDDLARRDFTVNSMALSYPDGVLLDPNAGREDLRRGVIRAVGDPRARFLDDPLRIVRAARICGIYGFRIAPATFEAMKEDAAKLEQISGERIREEIIKILTSSNLSMAFGLLRQSGALARILPALDAAGARELHEGAGVSILDHTLSCIINCPGRIRLRLAALFHESGRSRPLSGRGDPRSGSSSIAVETMKGWNMSSRLIDEVSTLVGHQICEEAFAWGDARLRRFITQVGPELLNDFIALGQAESLSGGWPQAGGKEQMDRLAARMKNQLGLISAFSIRELALGGKDIMEILGIGPGPEVGNVLKHLFDLVQEDPGLNTRESLRGIVEKNYRQANG